MTKRTIIQKCKELATLTVGNSPTIKIKSCFYFNYELEEVGIEFPIGIGEKELLIWNYFKQITNSAFTLFTYSVLHELGHYHSLILNEVDVDDFDIGNENESVLTKLFENDLISYEEAMNFYYNDKTESVANFHMKEYITTFYKEIEDFDRLWRD